MTKFGRQYISINVPTRNFGGIAPVIYADACEKNYNVSPTSVPENNHETNPTLDPNPNWGQISGGQMSGHGLSPDRTAPIIEFSAAALHRLNSSVDIVLM